VFMFCIDINGCKLIEIAHYAQFSVWKVALLYVDFGRKTTKKYNRPDENIYIDLQFWHVFKFCYNIRFHYLYVEYYMFKKWYF
jgi:hypothetical protein